MASRASPLVRNDVLERDQLALAIDRAAGARSVDGNRLEHFADSPRALEVMLALIAGATRWVHLENYIIRGDRTGQRFADALAERAAAGVRVRVLYDAVGSIGTPGRFWRRLRQAGVEVRAFHPVLSWRVSHIFSRDHRKLLVVDGSCAVLGGLCIGNEWAGDAERHRRPWRDTMLSVRGPAASVLDGAFAWIWRRAGPPLPPGEQPVDPDTSGDQGVRVIQGMPRRAHLYRAVELLAASATERLWITDAYLVAPAPLYASLLDAARGGVDVRILVPGTSDLPVLRYFTRVGYRELLHRGVRIFEYQGPMIHAKTMLVDRRWARVGSTNLNVSSLLTNYELDVLAEGETLCEALAAQFRKDLAASREIVLKRRRLRLPPRLVGEPAGEEAPSAHQRSRYELGAVAVVVLRRVAGGIRRAVAASGALVFAALGTLLLLFPRAMGIFFATVAYLIAVGFGLYALERRRSRESDDNA